MKPQLPSGCATCSRNTWPASLCQHPLAFGKRPLHVSHGAKQICDEHYVDGIVWNVWHVLGPPSNPALQLHLGVLPEVGQEILVELSTRFHSRVAHFPCYVLKVRAKGGANLQDSDGALPLQFVVVGLEVVQLGDHSPTNPVELVLGQMEERGKDQVRTCLAKLLAQLQRYKKQKSERQEPVQEEIR